MQRAAQVCLWLLACVAATAWARRGLDAAAVIAPIWPVVGLGIVWLRHQRMRAVSIGLLCVLMLGLDLWAYPSGQVGVVVAVFDMVHVVAVAWLMRRWCPELLWCGGGRGLDRLSSWWRLLASYAAPAVLVEPLGALVLHSVDSRVTPLVAVVWVLRNLGAGAVIVTCALLIAMWRRGLVPVLRRDASPMLAAVELAIAVSGTVLVLVLAFGTDTLPMAFPLLLPSVYVALRFTPLVSALHSLVLGSAAVVLSRSGHGPFTDLHPPELTPAMALTFVLLCTVTGMVISVSLGEREALTERLQQSRRDLQFNLGLLDKVIASMGQSLVVVAEDGRILMQNAMATRAIAEMSAGERVDNWFTLRERGPEVDDPWRETSPVGRALAGEQTRADVDLWDAHGRKRVLRVIAAPMADSRRDGGTLAVTLFDDVTAEVAHKAELNRFAGVVAHDLSNPLAAIRGWVHVFDEVLADGTLDAELAREFLSKVGSAADSMSDLITDLLQHARTRQLEVEPTVVELSELAREVAASMQTPGAVDLGDLPTVVADEVLLRQLFANLFSNSVKYVEPGTDPRIEVTGERQGGRVVVRVADNGIGIDPADRERVFEEFERGGVPGYSGTGLGLSICRRIVERHGGTIRALPNSTGPGVVIEFSLQDFDEAGQMTPQPRPENVAMTGE